MTAGLYFLLRGMSVKVQKGVLFGFLALGLALHFLKVYIPPYSVDEARMLRDRNNFLDYDWKNGAYIWGPGTNDPVGELLKKFTPEVFTKVPIGEHAGETKYWPWFWMICPVFCITIPLAAILALIFDFKSIRADVKALCAKLGKKKPDMQQQA